MVRVIASEPGPSPDRDPATLRWAVRLLLAQAGVLAFLTGLLGYLDLTREVAAARMAASVTGYAATMTALFCLVGVSLARRRRWARAPAIVFELLQVPVGYNLIRNGLPMAGVPILLGGLVGAGLLLAPATRFALTLSDEKWPLGRTQ